MTSEWTTSRVEELAPDASSWKAAEKLVSPSKLASWSPVGTDGVSVWSSFQGSGSKPYEVSVDTAEVRYKCSCPSRKFPCKHVLGLLLLWVDGKAADAIAPGAVAEWADKTPATRSPKSDASQTPEQREQAAQRLAEREARVDDGVSELLLWLDDTFHSGLRVYSGSGYGPFPDLSRHLVDAQAPGLARGLDECGAILAKRSSDWVEQLSARLGQLHSLAKAWEAREYLPAELNHAVRNHLGFTHRKADITAADGIADSWAVLGVVEQQEATTGRTVQVQRVWVYGTTTGRLVAVHRYDGDNPLLTGTLIDADLHLYPGSAELRAAIGAVRDSSDLAAVDPPPGPHTVAGAVEKFVVVRAQDPWARLVPVILAGSLHREDDRWYLITEDAEDAVVAVTGSDDQLWDEYLISGGEQVLWWGEWSTTGFAPFYRTELRPA